MSIGIIEQRQNKREYIIKKIQNTLKQAKAKDKVLHKGNFITGIISEFSISRRTAMEYINVALFREDMKAEEWLDNKLYNSL
ncbi:MAG: hypothetical protein ACOC5T_09305 [Elusimicrobiota bacterium]